MANAIAMLSSQILLIQPQGHYGLTFICFFPMGWYFIIKFYEKPGIKWSVIVAANTLFWTFTHVYLGLILSIFTFFAHIFHLLFHWKNNMKNLKRYGYFVIQVLVPVLLFYLFYKCTDHHPDRIDMPYVPYYNGSLTSVFLPVISPFQRVYELFFTINTDRCSWCKTGTYIGLSTNISVILFFCMTIYLLIKKKGSELLKFFSGESHIYVLSSLILLLYAISFPFMLIPDTIIDHLPFVKQFSSYGRVAWGFYYVITVIGFVFFFNLWKKYKYGIIIISIYTGILLFEGIYLHVQKSNSITYFMNVYNAQNLNKEQSVFTFIDSEDYQAILPLPFYYKFNIPLRAGGTDSSILCSMLASYHSGLPLMSTYLSRPSITETMKIFRQFVIPPYQKILPAVKKNGKDILVVLHKTDEMALLETENELLKKCIPVHRNSYCSLWALSIDSLSKTYNNQNKRSYDEVNNKLFEKNNAFVTDTNRFFINETFDQMTGKVTYMGDGAYTGIKNQKTLIYETETRLFDTIVNYNVSFWYYNYLWDQTFSSVVFVEKDEKNKIIQNFYIDPLNTFIIDGWWYFPEKDIKFKSNKGKLEIFISGGNYFENWVALDQLMIRPVDLDVYQEVRDKSSGENVVLRNNKKYVIQ